MTIISFKDVVAAGKAITKLEEKKIISFFKDFEKKQPVLYSYIIANAEMMKNDDARNDFAYIFSVVWKCYETKNPKMGMVTESELTKKENEHIKGWEKFSTIKSDKEEESFVTKFITQPEIWDFMLDIIFPEEDKPDESNFSQDETAIAFACINLMTALLNDKSGKVAVAGVVAGKKKAVKKVAAKKVAVAGAVAGKKKAVAKKKVAVAGAVAGKKKAVAKKKVAVAGAVAGKKKAVKKAPAKKVAVAGAVAGKKKVVKKVAAKKVAPKKVVAKKKVAGKKAPAKKVAVKKAPAKKVVAKKVAPKKVVKKVAPKKPVKKVVAKKAVKKTR